MASQRQQSSSWHCNVAGVTFGNRQQVLLQVSSGQSLTLVREPANPRDRCAIQVLARTRTGPAQIGYVPADIAKQIAPEMDAGTGFSSTVEHVFDFDLQDRQVRGCEIQIDRLLPAIDGFQFVASIEPQFRTQKRPSQPILGSLQPWLLLSAVAGGLWLIVLLQKSLSPAPSTAAVEQRLAYLTEDVQEVQWVVFQPDEVFIGIAPLAQDWQSIGRAAAVYGSQTTGRQFRAYLVDGTDEKFQPTAGFAYYGCAHAAGGRVTRFDSRIRSD